MSENIEHPSAYLPEPGKPVADWTLTECSAYVDCWDESYSEQYAEAGMGAVSLGLDPYYAAGQVSRPGSDPDYVAAKLRLTDAAKTTIRCGCGTPIPEGACECPPCHDLYLSSLNEEVPF